MDFFSNKLRKHVAIACSVRCPLVSIFSALSATHWGFPILKEKLPNLSEEQAKLLYQYISNGSGSVLRGWLAGESSMEERELAKFIMLTSGATVAAVAERG